MALSAQQVRIAVEPTPMLSYAMAHNMVPFIASLQLTNRGAPVSGAQVLVEVADAEGLVSAPWQRLVDLPAGGQVALQDVRPVLEPAAMLQVEEKRPAAVTVTVSHAGTVIGRSKSPVQLLAAHQWLAVPHQLAHELLAAFVMPNAPSISLLLREASDVLQRTSGSGSLEGYQGGPERADQIARAIFEAMQARRIRYSDPPASWTDVGQKIRTPEQVLEERVGTCLDTTVVMAAALEQAGLNPLLWLVPGHAFVGYWREEHVLATATTTDVGRLVNAVDLGALQVVETTLVTERREPVAFSEAHRPPYRRFLQGHLDDGITAIDVVAARRSAIVPLPARSRTADGGVSIVEYRPPERRSAQAVTVTAPARRDVERPSRAPVPGRVQQWKNALLDLSLRNRLVNYRESSGVHLEVPEGQLGALEDLVNAAVPLSLLPGDAFESVYAERGARSAADLPQDLLHEVLAERHALHTDLSSQTYATRLQNLAHKARTIVEETGANNLYLALGSLRWELDGRPVRSPLVLVPVRLSARARQLAYRLQLDEGGTSTPNYCLLEKLKEVHGLEVPGLAEPALDHSGIDLDAALNAVRVAVAAAGLPYRVEATADVAVLQFAKFRLWKDLDENWEAFASNPLVRHLVDSPTDPFTDPVGELPAVDLDGLAARCPVPADASQLQAIAEAAAGRTIVLEGPPGTGKSQTITNLLARCLAEGRRVLFVAEKRAALDVVRDRLHDVGMGPFSLDLHDKGSRPNAVRAQLKAALDHAVDVDEQGLAVQQDDLLSARRTLARYATRLHEPNGCGQSLYSARTQQLALGSSEATLPVPTAFVAAGGSPVAQVRAALAELPDVADPARPSGHHPWGLLDTTAPAGLDLDAVWIAAREVEAASAEVRDAGPVVPVIAVATTPAHLRAVAVVAEGLPVPLSVLDEVRTPDWRARATQVVGEVAAFAAQPRPHLQAAVPGVFALPLPELAAQAHAASSSGLLGRKRRLQAVLDDLRPGLVPGLEVDLRHLPEVLDALAQTHMAVHDLTLRVRAVSGLAVGDAWDPLLPQDRQALEERVLALQRASDVLAPTSPTADALRQYAGHLLAGAADPAAPVVQRVATAWEDLALAAHLDDDDLEAWCAGTSLLERWRQTAPGRGLHDERQRSLRSYAAFLSCLDGVRTAGLIDTHRALVTGEVAADGAVRAFERGVAAACLQERREATGLESFRADIHARTIERFTTSAQSVRQQVRAELAHQVIAARSFQASTGRGRVGELQRELTRQRGGLGVRALMSTYGDLITQVMPCVLVSPDSLARFFPAQAGIFDTVVFDEASQIRVADAVGAMGRATSVVVVGDSKQMPPTVFGEAGTADDDDASADEDLYAVEDQESILSECVLARVPRHWLSWHYRSQDESLIAFSNRYYYEDRLSSFPAPVGTGAEQADRGISLVRVDGRFHRSGDRAVLRTNPVEAAAVVAEIRRRFDASSDITPSLGVVTFNQQQRAHVEALLRELHDERITAALDTVDEGLFVKNLENVQGDERDAILFSTAFSTNDKGVLPLNFGPLNRGGGERRLNVAITRARRQVVVFSSFDPAQLRAEETTSIGVKHLRAYLDLAANGAESLGQGRRRLRVVDRHRDQVADALRARGLVVTTDVGLSDFKVDLSVALPEHPETPVMAVLLDGPGWSARRTVGDRDGLPVEVLSRLLRWPSVERVWLPAWLDDPAEVLDALERAARSAVVVSEAPPVQAPAAVPTPRPSVDVPVDEQPSVDGAVTQDDDLFTGRHASSALLDVVTEEVGEGRTGAEPVVAGPTQPARPGAPALPGEAAFTPWSPGVVGERDVLDRLSDPFARSQVRKALSEAVAAEGPVQAERLGRLVGQAFGLSRVRADRIQTLLELLPQDLRERRDGDFIWPVGVSPEEWTGFRRAPGGGARPPEEVSLREIGNAMVALCATSGGMARDELLRQALAIFGGRRLTTGIAERLDEAVQWELEQRRLSTEGPFIRSTTPK